MTDLWEKYYDRAEKCIDVQWQKLIVPMLTGINYSSVIELAPGHGRCTQYLLPESGRIHLVDIDQANLDFCRERFKDHPLAPRLTYARTEGRDLPGVAAGRATFIFCFDSMVHFEPGVVEAYVAEFARVLAAGGRGLVHYSNLAECDTPMQASPHWRRQMGRDTFHRLLDKYGLRQVLSRVIDWAPYTNLDALTLFEKPMP